MNSIPLLGDTQLSRRLRAEFADLRPRASAWIVVVQVSAWLTGAILIVTGQRFGNWLAVLALAAAAAYGERGHITLRDKVTVSISLLPAIFAAVLFGPLSAMVVFGASAVSIAFPLPGRICYVGTRALTGALAAGSVALVGSIAPAGTGRTVAAAAVAALVAEVSDTVFAAVTFWLRGTGSWKDIAADSLPVIAASVPFYGFAVAILALSYQNVSPWTLPLFYVPALGAQRWFLLYQEQRRLADDLKGANEQLRAANLSFARGLIATLDARDRYTAGHSAAVAIYARDIAERMGMDPVQQELAHLCGLVHDIGKIGLPAGLLEKPGALTLDERREMQRHSEIGEGILANVDTYAEIASIVRHHHERVDGQGYPDGLSGTDIPLLSRIIAVADAYNAMTTIRPYRNAMAPEVAIQQLVNGRGSQFQAELVDAFVRVLEREPEAYRLGVKPDFSLESMQHPELTPPAARLRTAAA